MKTLLALIALQKIIALERQNYKKLDTPTKK